MMMGPRLFRHTSILLCALSHETACSIRSNDVAPTPAEATSSPAAPAEDVAVERAVTPCEESGDVLRQCNTADPTTDVFRPAQQGESSSCWLSSEEDHAVAAALQRLRTTPWGGPDLRSPPPLNKSSPSSLETVAPHLFQTIGKALRGTSSGNSLACTSHFLHRHRRALLSLSNLQVAIARSEPLNSFQHSERLLALRSLHELHSAAAITSEPELVRDIIKVLLLTCSSERGSRACEEEAVLRGYDAEISPLTLTILLGLYSDTRGAWLEELREMYPRGDAWDEWSFMREERVVPSRPCLAVLRRSWREKYHHLTAEQLLHMGTPISNRFHRLRKQLRPLVPQIADIVLSQDVPGSDTVTIEQGVGLLYELLAEFTPDGLQVFFFPERRAKKFICRPLCTSHRSHQRRRAPTARR